jgi:hypothetical protein
VLVLSFEFQKKGRRSEYKRMKPYKQQLSDKTETFQYGALIKPKNLTCFTPSSDESGKWV